MSSEADIQRAILDAFAAIGVLAWRVHAGKVQVRGGWMSLAPPGTPDVMAIAGPSGRLLALEIKSAKGRERDAQVRWAEVARRQGAYVATVRSPAEALAALEACRVPAECSEPATGRIGAALRKR